MNKKVVATLRMIAVGKMSKQAMRDAARHLLGEVNLAVEDHASKVSSKPPDKRHLTFEQGLEVMRDAWVYKHGYGLSDKEVGRQIDRSPVTVRIYVMRIERRILEQAASIHKNRLGGVPIREYGRHLDGVSFDDVTL